ncbi:MAG: phosphoenolpyruvate--protein phosphotransferase [bacterium]
METRLFGIPASTGVVIAPARLFRAQLPSIRRRTIDRDLVDREIARFQRAVAASRKQIEAIRERQRPQTGDTTVLDILDTQLVFLKDPMLVGQTENRIRTRFESAEYALSQVVGEAEKIFAQKEDPIFRERFADIQDIGRRILGNLLGGVTNFVTDLLEEQVILIAHDLSPSDTATMPTDKIIGFATEVGGPTSHTAILARSLQIPAVVGVTGLLGQVGVGDTVILDGSHGAVVVNPSTETRALYEKVAQEIAEHEAQLMTYGSLPAVTLDGHALDIAANIEMPEEAAGTLQYGANGVGLFRTEYLFMASRSLPTEEDQFQAYRRAIEGVEGRPVVIRTLDLGGDKFAHTIPVPEELNPFMGWRAIRFCLQNRDLFRTQLRAILRAGAFGNARMMFPFISGVKELCQALEFLSQVKEELRREGAVFDDQMPVGGMIELPSAVMVAEDLASHLDFFSIGSNDLIQYSLAIDRINEKIAHLYQPLHPAVLRMIHQVVRVGRRHAIPVEICGEMAANPLCFLVLLGLGLERFSMSPVAIPRVKAIVRSIRMEQLRSFGERILDISTAEQVERYALRVARRILPRYPWDEDRLSAVDSTRPVDATPEVDLVAETAIRR